MLQLILKSLLGLAAHWDHERFRIPLNRPSGTFSPTGGEGWDEGVRFMESLRSLRPFNGIMNWFVLVLVLVLEAIRSRTRTRTTTGAKGRFLERRSWIGRWLSLI